MFIIFTHRLSNQTFPEVEFSSENEDAKRVPSTLENEYTISVSAPGKYLRNYVSSFLIVDDMIWKASTGGLGFSLEMPAGVVSLTMHTDQSSVSLGPVTYYTSMGEVSRYLEKAVDPMTFLCQVGQQCGRYYTGGSLLFKAETFCPVRLLILRQVWRNPWTICSPSR